MITLTSVYQELGRSSAYAFSSYGQVCACLYARMASADTVAVKLTRIITGSSSGVGYSYDAAEASLSGSLAHSWSGGASGMVYVGEHTVFEQTFSVTPGTTLSLSAIYDDSYITARTVNGACTVAGSAPEAPVVTLVIFDSALQTRYANVTVYWECENADRYHVSICRLTVPGDQAQGGDVVYETDVYEKGVTFGLNTLPLKAGDDLFFMVQASNAAGGSGNGFSDFYRLRPTLWRRGSDGWQRVVPWVKVNGSWKVANRVYIKDGGEWREIQ